MGRTNKLFLYSLVLTVLVAIVYWKFFLLGKIPIPADLMTGVYYPWLDYKWGYSTGVPIFNTSISDVYSQFFPWKYLIIDIFKNGEIPLWNQYSYSGTPLLESYHSGVLLPFNLILLLPRYFGWGMFIFSQTLAAAIGMFLFLQTVVKNRSSQIIGSLIFSLSGLMTTWVEFGTGVWASAMMPWILFFISRYLSKPKIRYLVGTSFSLICLFFAGHAQLTIYLVLLVAAYIIHLRAQHKNIDYKNILHICLVILLSCGIAMLQIYPVLLLTSETIRSTEFSYIKQQNSGLTPWYDMIRIFVSDFFGNPTTSNYRGDVSYYENSPFLSTLALPLLLPILITRKLQRKTIFWTLTLLFSFIISISSPLTQFIYNLKIPLLTYSSAARIFFITGLSASILVAIGSQELLNSKKYRQTTFKVLLLLLLTIIFALSYSYMNNSFVDFKVSARNSFLPIVMISIVMGVIMLNLNKKYFGYLLLILIFFDLFRYFNKFNPFVDKKIIFPDTPVTTFLKNQSEIFRIGRLSRNVITPNTWLHYKISSTEGYDPMALENYSRFFNLLNNNSYDDSITRFSEMYDFNNNYADALNIKYLLAVKNDENADKNKQIEVNLKKVFEDKSVLVYENPTVQNRAYFVNSLQITTNKDDLIKIINNKNHNPKSTAVILGNTDKINKYAVGKVEIVSVKNNSLEIKTNNHQDGFLVIANSYTNGWKAKIDNNSVPIFETNGALQGIFVPSGERKIIIYYWPDSFNIGLIISIISFTTLSCLLICIYFNKKNHPENISLN
jgi:hypothetical protein